MQISITKTTAPKAKPDWNKLGFGKYDTDHMFIMDYVAGQGWMDARIVPYQPLQLDPAAICLHYGIEIFEGMKAYPGKDGKVRLFRPADNAARINRSGARLCMPHLPEEMFVEAVKTLVNVEREWVPTLPDTSLYIRPFIIANEAQLGVHVADRYQFIIILSPSGAYYPEGLNPVKIYVEDEYVRAVRGGTGFTKCGGNYAAAMIAQQKAHELGYSQVLWLDGVERKYINEVGAMNIMFRIDDEIVTPDLEDGTILPGVTRDSVLKIAKSWGISVAERRISVDELADAARNGRLKEAWGTGTAAVVSPVGELRYEDEVFVIGGGKIGEYTQRIYDELTGIQWGKVEDKFGWTMEF